MAHPVLEYLNTAVALSTFLISSDLRATVENVKAYFRGNPSDLDVQFELPQEIALINLIIEKDLLDDLTKRVGDSITDERNCLQNARTGQEMDACGRRAEKSICNNLNYIKDRNDDDLPTDYLDDKWGSYGCVRA